MAVQFSSKSIDSTKLDQILSDLTFVPKKNNYSFRTYQSDTSRQIIFYQVSNGVVTIPMNFGEKLLSKKLNDLRKYPKVAIKFVGELRKRQLPVTQKCIDFLNSHRGVTLQAHPGFGKTVISSYISSAIGLVTMVLINSTGLIKQWKKSFETFTDADVWVIGKKCTHKNINVIICMSGRIDKVPQQFLDAVGLLVIDEAHTFCTETRIKTLLRVKPRYILSCTATPDRDDGLYSMIESSCGLQRVIQKSEKPFIVYKFNTGIEVVEKKRWNNMMRKNITDWTDMVNKLAENKARNSLILGLVSAYYKQNKILVLTRRVQHAKSLSQWLTHYKIKNDFLVGTKNSYEDTQVLIGSVEKIGTGFDEELACENFGGVRLDLLILTISIKSVNLLIQVAGRVFRSQFPEIIYLTDKNRIVRNHFSAGKKWMTESNGIIYEYTYKENKIPELPNKQLLLKGEAPPGFKLSKQGRTVVQNLKEAQTIESSKQDDIFAQMLKDL